MRQLTRIPTFGIAVADGNIYLATWYLGFSAIIVGKYDALLSGRNPGWREIYRVNVLTDAGRIHQISAVGDALWLANTSRNTYTKIDRNSGAWMGNIAPFRCSFGHPILIDHNHVNSVFAQPGYLLCAAFKINEASCLALCGDGEARLYSYPNLGVHDCILTGDDLLFCDSYRMWENGKGGAALRNGRVIDPGYFDANPAYFVRALAGHGDELLIGNSHAGETDHRYSGSGALLLAHNDKIVTSAELPFAQVYDLLREDGTHFETPPGPRSFSEAARVLDTALGAPVETAALANLLCGERAKKFDKSDRGHVEEYL